MGIDRGHEVEEFLAVGVGDLLSWGVFLPREADEVEGLSEAGFVHGFAACLSGHDIECLPAGNGPIMTVAAVVATLDEKQILKAELVEVFAAVDSDFAYED